MKKFEKLYNPLSVSLSIKNFPASSRVWDKSTDNFLIEKDSAVLIK